MGLAATREMKGVYPMGNLNSVDCSHDEMVAALALCIKIKANAVSDVVFDTLVEAAKHKCLAKVTRLFRDRYDNHRKESAKDLGIVLLDANERAMEIITEVQKAN